jgi:hypothetical protein
MQLNFAKRRQIMPAFRKAVGYGTSMLAVLVLLFYGSAKAQETPIYKPGQTIRFSVTFEGADASKINSAQMFWDTPKAPDDQPNFETSINTGGSSKKIPGQKAFELSYLVPSNQASGEYTLTQIRGGVDSPSLTLQYPSQEIPTLKLTIKNTQTFERPKVKDVKVLSGP